MERNERDRTLIVGAGPVGLVAALRLARAGIPVTVIEQAPALEHDLRASTFHPPTLEMLDELGLTAGLIERGLEVPHWQVRMHETGERALFDLSVIASDTRYPFRLQCEQWKLCEMALGQAREEGLFEVLFGHRLDTFEQDDDTVTATVIDPSGEPVAIEARWLVAADGSRSRVRELLDLPFEGLTYPETTILATTRFPFEEHLEGLSNVNYVWIRGGTYSLLRLPGLWRCSLYATPEETVEEATEPGRIETKLQRIVPRDEPYDVMEIRPYRIHQRIIDHYRHGRVLFAGDAAHINSPSGGMGMNGGVHDAWNLSEKLPRVYAGESVALLDLYSRQRQPIAKDEILSQAHRNRTRMMQPDQSERERTLRDLQAIAGDPVRAREYLLKSSMINGLRRSAEIV
jgi:3-(3-hydroxy-phenyl)propionate hydroxylase